MVDALKVLSESVAAGTKFIASNKANEPHTEAPRIVIVNVAALATNGNWTVAKIEAEYFSTGFQHFISRIDQKHWRDFDGDLLTGTQEPEGLQVLDVTEHGNIVTAIYKVKETSHNIPVDFWMKLERGNWKIDDIVYHEVKTESFRSMMTRPVED